MNDTNDVFKFSPDNLKQKQKELKNKKSFKLNNGNYDEYVEFILNSFENNVGVKCIKTKCRYCYNHMFWESALTCKLDGSTFAKDSEKNCIIDSHIKSLEKNIELLRKYEKFIKYKGEV